MHVLIYVSHSTCVCHSECTVVLQPPYYVSPYKQSQIIVNIVCFTTSKMHTIDAVTVTNMTNLNYNCVDSYHINFMYLSNL